MTSYNHSFDDIPGTTVFDSKQSRLGYHLNMFCMSLVNSSMRTEFKSNETQYLERFPMTVEQRIAVLDRDYGRLIELGGNVYFLGKLSATDDVSFGAMVVSMTDMSGNEYLEMMAKGGRSVEGNRSKSERGVGKERQEIDRG